MRKFIPNTITSLNLLCGTCGVVAAGFGRLDAAFILMLCGAVCDFLDGFTARMLNAYSAMGKELDSLADEVTFGLLPALMMFMVMSDNFGYDSILSWIPLLIAVFSGLRLAKFNVDERQTTSFIGLPTPACAMVCGAIGYFSFVAGETSAAQLFKAVWLIPSVSVILCVLLVSGIPMFSMKLHKGEKLGWQRITFLASAVATCVLTAVAGLNWSLAVLVIFTFYIIINIIGAIAAAHAKR